RQSGMNFGYVTVNGVNSNSSGTSGRYRYPELFGLRCVILEDYYKSGSEAYSFICLICQKMSG
ncbi:hypothetical protein, partial [Blautia wexlerae]|uniref:hypothetical protein n=1 Tax=Blautia wexlerae TaxID=418240 RepID=UPI001A9B4BAE